MKQTLITLGLKLAVKILECLIDRIATKSGTKVKTEFVQDVQINENTAKKFADFIKKCTVIKKDSAE